MRLRLPALALALAATAFVRADEGMWTFDNLPLAKMKAKYGFAPDQAWLDHLRLSVVRFPGGTGSFVSKDGLILTNHHVGRGWTQQVSGPGEKDYIKNGFVAADREHEIKIPGGELYNLQAMENITAQVQAAVKPDMTPQQAQEARDKVIEALKAETEKKTGLTCELVTLYQGGEYWMYQYKKFTDIRLVMAPEGQIAFWGGDPDNFTYPRHDLDFTLFRVYEDGKPCTPPHHLQFTKGGLKAGDLTFVSGHPGRTSRLETLAQMKFAGEVGFPNTLKNLERQIAFLKQYGSRGEEQMRQVRSTIFSLENSQKAITGYWAGLKDAEAMKRIEQDEEGLKTKVAADPSLTFAKESWGQIQTAVNQEREAAFLKDSLYVNTRGSILLGHALGLVRLPEEVAKPNDKRLAEYKETNLPAFKKRMVVPQPYYPELEIARFADGLKEAEAALGKDHPFVKAMLDGKSAGEVAEAAVKGSKLGDPAERQRLLEGGAKALAGSQDPMILLAKKLDPLGRALRKKQDDLDAIVKEHGGRIAKARFKIFGKEKYPDATFSLRLTYGPVAGYKGNGTFIQPFTTFYGLYDRYYGQGMQGDWALPQRWLDKKGALDLATPYNFSHAVDIIGGNSGSPVVDVKGELVGLIFDGNIESLPGRYFYDEQVNRGVSVDARALLEALDKVYEAKGILAELKGN